MKISVYLGFAKPEADNSKSIDDALSKLDPDAQKLVNVKSFDQLQNLQESSKLKDELLVVKFGAEWCKPCKAIQPFYEKLSATPGATFCIVDVDEADAALKAVASSLPTFVVYKAKAEVQRHVGGDEGRLFATLQAAGLFGCAADLETKTKEEFDFSAAPCKS